MVFVHPRDKDLQITLPPAGLEHQQVIFCRISNSGNVRFRTQVEQESLASEHLLQSEPVLYFFTGPSSQDPLKIIWQVKAYNASDFESLSTKERSLRYVAAMTKGSRLLDRPEVMKLKQGYFLTRHGGVLDAAHVLSGINDTLKMLRVLHQQVDDSGLLRVDDHMYWHVQGHEGFNFRFKCEFKKSKGSMMAQAMVACILRHYVWETLQQHPKVVKTVGLMSQASSFAAEDIVSYYAGILVAYKMTKSIGETPHKGLGFMKAREEALGELLSELVFIPPSDPLVQNHYYDIVDILAKGIVVDPTHPLLWGELQGVAQPKIFKGQLIYELLKSCELEFPTPWVLETF